MDLVKMSNTCDEKIFFYHSTVVNAQIILLFHAGEAIVRRTDHHNSRSGDGGVGQGGVVHKIGGKKDERELVGIVENRDTRRCDQSVELKRRDAQTKPERARDKQHGVLRDRHSIIRRELT